MDTMLTLKTKADLDALFHNEVQESATIEYKATPAVDNTEPRKTEIARVASAFANADGGQIIYGMTEDKHKCTGLDDGIDPARFNGLWFEQVIQQNVRPQIEGLHIQPVPLGNGNFAYVITIPAAQSRGPHQLVKDHVYYRRRNFRNDKMEDYEIREAMNRDLDPNLQIDFSFRNVSNKQVSRPTPASTDQFEITTTLVNLSRRPAFHAIVEVFITNAFVAARGTFEDHGSVFYADVGLSYRLQRLLSSPPEFPIFREKPRHVGHFNLSLPTSSLSRALLIGWHVAAPGCSNSGISRLSYESGTISIERPLAEEINRTGYSHL